MTHPCKTCDGHGELYELVSGRGGNDPDNVFRSLGECEACHGSGNHYCDFCDAIPAVTRYDHHGRDVLICAGCLAEEAELHHDVEAAERGFVPVTLAAMAAE